MKYKCDFLRIHKDINLKKVNGETEIEENNIKYRVFDALITKGNNIINTKQVKTFWEQEYQVKIWTTENKVHRLNGPAIFGLAVGLNLLQLSEYWYDNKFVSTNQEFFINITRKQHLDRLLN